MLCGTTLHQPRRHHGPALPRPLPHEAPGVHGHSGEPRLSVYGVGSLLSGPFSGLLCDRFGSLRVMKTSLLGRAPPAFWVSRCGSMHRSRLPGRSSRRPSAQANLASLSELRAAPRGLRAQPPSDLGWGIKRKFEQFYRNTPFRQATLLHRQEEGRRDDEMLFSALTNPQRISPWLDALLANHIPLVGIYSIPNISTPLLRNIPSVSAAVILGKRRRTAANLFQQQAIALFAPDPDQHQQYLQRVRRDRNAAHSAIPEESELASTRRNAGRLHHLRWQ